MSSPTGRATDAAARGGRPARLLHRAFEASVLVKGLFAAGEALLGALLYHVANDRILTLVRWLTAHEITEDPNDVLAAALLRMVQSLSVGTQDFFASYLVVHGVLKLAVVLLLARGILWANPLAVVVLSGFVLYQAHRFVLHPDVGLVLLSLLDLAVIVLTLLEYRRLGTAN